MLGASTQQGSRRQHQMAYDWKTFVSDRMSVNPNLSLAALKLEAIEYTETELADGNRDPLESLVDYAMANMRTDWLLRNNSSGSATGAAGPGTPSGQKSSAAPPSRPATLEEIAGMSVRGAIAAEMLLDMDLDGVPLRRATAGYARAWATRSAINATFVMLMANGLADDAIIGNHRSDTAARRFFAKAKLSV